MKRYLSTLIAAALLLFTWGSAQGESLKVSTKLAEPFVIVHEDGRLDGIIWMFAGIILISSFTAAISASLTVQQLNSGIQSADDLPGAKVATLEGTAAAAVLSKRSIGQWQEILNRYLGR
jgi:hypothetical protein